MNITSGGSVAGGGSNVVDNSGAISFIATTDCTTCSSYSDSQPLTSENLNAATKALNEMLDKGHSYWVLPDTKPLFSTSHSLINNQKKMSNKLTPSARRNFTKEQKLLYKAKLIDSNGEITPLGSDELEAFLFQKFEKEMLSVANEIIEENK